MIEIAVILALPFSAGALLALWGARKWAAEFNIAASFATFVAAAALTAAVDAATGAAADGLGRRGRGRLPGPDVDRRCGL